MIACFEERRQDSADSFDCRPDIRIFQRSATIVQTDNISFTNTREHFLRNSRGRQFPVQSYNGPHDRSQTELPLGLAEAEPSHPVGRPQPAGNPAGRAGDGPLCAREFLLDKRGTFSGEKRVRI